jgi:N4-(beta-N-acetylglucosaminyl)-L-asparaginase
MHRRNFLQWGSLGLSAISFSGFRNAGIAQKPLVISTWDAGIAANAAA